MGKFKKAALQIGLIFVTAGAAAYVAASLGAVGALRTIASVAKFLAITRGLSAISAALGPKPPRQIDPGQQVEYTGTVEPRRIIYGTVRVSGVNVLPPYTSGSKNEYLHQVLVLAGHECNSIGDVFLGLEEVDTAAMASITGAAGDGAVTTGSYANKIWIRRYTGTSTQTVDWKLNNVLPSYWPSTARGRGVAYLAITYLYDPEVYRTGRPNVTAVIQGKKVYDPRLDTSPGANPTNASYIAYSANPALCLADYLTDNSLGLGEAATRIDWASVVTAADICDELVSIPGSTTQKRYTLNGTLDCTAPYEDNIEALALAMLGNVVYSGGKWRMFAGAWEAPSFTITDSDVVGKVDFRTALPYRERFNAVRGQFYDASQNYQPTEYPVVRVSADETADGEGPIWKEANFPFCTNVYEAQRNAIILQRLSRRRKRYVLECGLSAYAIRIGETGTLTLTELGISAAYVRCTGWQFNAQGTISLTLDEAAEADWDDPSTGTYTTPSSVSSPTPGAYKPDSPSGLTAQGMPNGIQFTWTLPALRTGEIVIELWEATSNDFTTASKIWDGYASGKFITKFDTTTRYYWILCRMKNGQISATDPALTTGGLPAAATTTATALGASVSPGSVGKVGTTSTLTTGSAAVTAYGGTAPYTYSWTFTSGGTGVTITSSTSSSTTFSATGLAVDETRSGTARCRVTDNVAATYDVYVSVQITRTSSS